MYDLLILIQYIGIVGLFIESWLVLKSWKDSLRAYLFFSCVATLINNLGYLLELKAKSLDAYITALQLSYAGRIWICFSLFLFVFELSNIKIPKIIINGLVLIHAGIYAAVLTLQHHDLYYSDIDFTMDGQFPVLIHKDGIVHNIFFMMQGILIVLGMSVLIISYARERKKVARKRILMVMIAFVIEILFFVINIFNITNVYDFTMIGSILGMVFMFISIFRYNLLGMRDIARDFMVDRLSEGVIAIDNEGDIQYYNEPAGELFPQIEEDPAAVIDSVQGAILHGKTISINDRIFTPEENDLLYNGESFGKLYVLIDATEHYDRLKKEKKMLRKELLTDPITGFYNRKGMLHYSEKMYLDVFKSHKSLFLCVADMNGLKYINDTFGHEHGDKAIAELAGIIRESLTEGDMAFRTGGDEFLIMGERTGSGDHVKDYEEKIEKLIKRHNKDSDLPYGIDMSYGPIVAELTGVEGELDKLISLSDSKMYEMKRSRDSYRRE